MKKVLILTFTVIILLAFVKKVGVPSNDEYDEQTPLMGSIIYCQNSEQSSDALTEKVSYEYIDSVNIVIINYHGFSVLYSASVLQPILVEYTLTAEQVEKTAHTPRISRHYSPDPDLPLPQASNYDYKGSGWTRGHMAKRQDLKWSEQAVRESDYFTNICPQKEELNMGVWDDVEKKVV